MEKQARSFGTHDGSFHADEVTACALLLFVDLIDRDKIIRTRDVALLARCEYVCDVGGIWDPARKLFDHHQASYTGSMSSAGMVLEYLAKQTRIRQELFSMLRHTLVAAVDAHDNGKDPAPPGVPTYSTIMASFCPIQQEASKEELDKAFMEALDFGLSYIRRLVDRYQYIEACQEDVAEAMKKTLAAQDALGKKVLIFPRAIPWMDAFFERGGDNHPACFIIMPVRGQWKLRAIPPTLTKRMQVRVPLPKSWAGLEGEAFVKASGIPGAIFCHKGRFIAIFKDKEGALAALEKTVALGGENEDDL